MKKKILIVSAFTIVLILFGIYFFLNKTPSDVIETYGNIEIRTVDLSFQVAGVIKEI